MSSQPECQKCGAYIHSGLVICGKCSDWQDISTAPKDGTRVDLWCVNMEGPGVRFSSCRLQPDSVEGDFWADQHGYRLSNHGCVPTHWRPLPTPPTEKDKA